MKTKLAIKITNSSNYIETVLYKYYYLINKLIYLAYNIRPNITFAAR